MKKVTTKGKTRKIVISLKTIMIGNTTMVTMIITNMAARIVTKMWLTTTMTITTETTNGNTA